MSQDKTIKRYWWLPFLIWYLLDAFKKPSVTNHKTPTKPEKEPCNCPDKTETKIITKYVDVEAIERETDEYINIHDLNKEEYQKSPLGYIPPIETGGYKPLPWEKR